MLKFRCKILTPEFKERVDDYIAFNDDHIGWSISQVYERLAQIWLDNKVYTPKDIPGDGMSAVLHGKSVQYFMDHKVYSAEYTVEILEGRYELDGISVRATYRGRTKCLNFVDEIIEITEITD
jgi:hypothetical protein